MKKQLDELADNGLRLRVDRINIGEKAAEASDEIRAQIKNELKDKVFSIVIDICKKKPLLFWE